MTANGNGNGARSPKPLASGIYAPVVTPFDKDEEIDFAAFEKHVTRMADAGVGLVVMGTNGEAIHLNPEERYQLVAAARKAVGDQLSIIAGTGTGSVKETIRNCVDASKAGADAAIVIAPGYFAGALASNKKALKEFFTEVAEHSPIPVMLYNFPACVGGVDLDSDLLIEVAQHPNVIGAKLTCAMVGKGARIVEAIQRPGFQVMTGFADILLPSMMVGLTGTICGTANLAPRTTVHLYNLIEDAIKSKDFAKLEEAQKLQGIVSKADWIMFKGGIGGTKYVLDKCYYPVGECRRPLPPASDEAKKMLVDGVAEILELERQFEKKAGVQVAKA